MRFHVEAIQLFIPRHEATPGIVVVITIGYVLLSRGGQFHQLGFTGTHIDKDHAGIGLHQNGRIVDRLHAVEMGNLMGHTFDKRQFAGIQSINRDHTIRRSQPNRPRSFYPALIR